MAKFRKARHPDAIRAYNEMETYHGEVEEVVYMAVVRARSPQVRRALRRLLLPMAKVWARAVGAE